MVCDVNRRVANGPTKAKLDEAVMANRRRMFIIELPLINGLAVDRLEVLMVLCLCVW